MREPEIRFRSPTPGYCCPYCRRPVGYLGRAMAWLFGTRVHGCDFSNVEPPSAERVAAASSSLPEAERTAAA